MTKLAKCARPIDELVQRLIAMTLSAWGKAYSRMPLPDEQGAYTAVRKSSKGPTIEGVRRYLRVRGTEHGPWTCPNSPNR